MSEGFREDQSPNGESPMIGVNFGNEKFIMTENDTLLRFFDVCDGMFDHVAHRTADGRYIAFIPDREVLEEMLETGFPTHTDQVVDSPTISWFADRLEEGLVKLLKRQDLH